MSSSSKKFFHMVVETSGEWGQHYLASVRFGAWELCSTYNMKEDHAYTVQA